MTRHSYSVACADAVVRVLQGEIDWRNRPALALVRAVKSELGYDYAERFVGKRFDPLSESWPSDGEIGWAVHVTADDALRYLAFRVSRELGQNFTVDDFCPEWVARTRERLHKGKLRKDVVDRTLYTLMDAVARNRFGEYCRPSPAAGAETLPIVPGATPAKGSHTDRPARHA